MKKIQPGYIAFILSLCALVPQFSKLIETHDISSFSLLFVFLGMVSQICWISQGIFFSNDKSIIINALIFLTFYSYIFYLIIAQRLGKISEKHDGNERGNIITKEEIKELFRLL